MTGAEDCPSCGEWIGADATWCLHCGSAVPSTAGEEEGDAGAHAAGDASADPHGGDGTVTLEASEAADRDANDGETNAEGDLDDGAESERLGQRTPGREDEGSSVGRLEVALHFVNRYEWLRGTFAIVVLAAIGAVVGTLWPAGSGLGELAFWIGAVWLYAITRAGTKRILVHAAYGTAGLLAVGRLRAAVFRGVPSDLDLALRILLDGPTLVVVAALLVGAQLLSTLVVQPADPYGVQKDPD